MIEVNNVRYTENMDPMSFEIGGKGIHGIFCDRESEMKLLTDILSGARDSFEGDALVVKDRSKAPASKCRSKIGCVLSDMPLYRDMTAEEALDFVGRAKRIEPDKRYRQIKEAISLVGIEKIAKKQIGRLSAQNKLRISIAQALLGNPDIVIFEAPTSNVDENCAKEICELIQMLGKMKSVVILSADDSLLIDLCEDVLVISSGSLLFSGSSDELSSHLEGGKRLSVKLKGSEENIEKASKAVLQLKGVEKSETDGNVLIIDFDASHIGRDVILNTCEQNGCVVRSVKISARAVVDSLCSEFENNAKEEE